MDDSGSRGDIGGEVLDIAGDVVKTIGGELKKLGKTATSQVVGSGQNQKSQPAQDPSTSPTSDNTAVSSDEQGTSFSKQLSLGSEFKKIGSTLGSQITGSKPAAPDIADMKKKDKEFSDAETESLRKKIDQIYREHGAKVAREREQKAALAQQAADRKKAEEVRQVKRIKEETNPGVAKTRAEIKNYGAE